MAKWGMEGMEGRERGRGLIYSSIPGIGLGRGILTGGGEGVWGNSTLTDREVYSLRWTQTVACGRKS